MIIGINAGHTITGLGSGAVGIINESTETRAVGNALMNLLKANGHEVVNCTIDKASSQNAYLAQAVEMANRQDLDYFISFHFNAYNGKAFGTEVYTYEGRQFADALEVCANISALGFANRGVKNGTGLYVVKKTKAKSMLIEVCFVDNVEDVETYKRVGANTIAEAVYKAIAYTNVDTVQPQPTPAPTPQPAQKPSGDDWVRCLQEECNTQGYSNQKIDGLAGPDTLAGCPELGRKSKGNITRLAQERLNALGYNCGAIDGANGPKTQNAIKRFQADRGLVQDGIIGTNTWRKLLGLS